MDNFQNHYDPQENLFNSSGWLEILKETLGARIVFKKTENLNDIYTISIFHAGPFRIGYPGFPIGLTLNGHSFDSQRISTLISDHSDGVHQFRIPLAKGCEVDFEKHKIRTTYITKIKNLNEWSSISLSDSVQRNIRKAGRSGINITHANSNEHSKKIYDLYRQTILRHNGSLRYNDTYFFSLIALAQKTSKIRCFLAILSDEIIGFMIVGIQNNIAYYLHGSINYKFQIFRPYDLLFIKAIEWAKEKNCNEFNMMDTPINQPSLVKFKEKWGGETEIRKYVYINNNWIMGNLFSIAASIYDNLKIKLSRLKRN